MLPEDAKKRKVPVPDKSWQSSVTDHFGLEDTDTKPIPYNDDAFKTAAIECQWLIKTNQVRLGRQYILPPILIWMLLQPIQTFSHPAFKKMLDIASQANKSINLPSPKQSRTSILKMFKQQLGCCTLASWYVSFLYHLSSHTNTQALWYRAPLSKGKSASRVTHGKPVTLMHTLQSLATGLRSLCLASGQLRTC